MQLLGITTTTGEARSTRYLLVAQAPQQSKDIGKTEIALPLKEECRKVFALVSRPTQQRTPVGYHLEFLELYQANVTIA